MISYANEEIMKEVQLATRIDSRVKAALQKVCTAKGLKMKRLIEEAILDKLEELEDIEDINKIVNEPTKPLAELLKDLKLDELL
jgi:hypothetical protein